MTVQASSIESENLPDPGKTQGEPEEVAGRSPTQLAIGRFRKDRLSMVSFVVVVLVLVAAIAAPILVHLGVLDPYTYHNSGKGNLLDENTLPKGGFGGISWSHPLGVEPGTGRDALSRFWYGITFSLVIGLLACLIAVVLGAILGIIAGFSRSWADTIIGRAIDLTLSFPQTLMLLALSSTGLLLITDYTPIPSGPMAQATYAILVLGIFGWPATARVVRGQVLSIREREFIDAAVLLGASRWRIYFKEILPNLWAPLLVLFTLTMPAYVSAEAALSYLGVSIKPPTPTLGNVLRDSLQYAQVDFIYFLIPALLIAVIVVSFNLLGDGLRDALDPKSNR
ncbi:MAG: ABC transporter permease [Nocardioides sp.]|uniref:ABC transporter permease n=1 Tax=Nocardioides sp. TaxID=35761 RepID=UPI0039E5D025